MKRLEEELEKYGQSDYYAFHMPGHKRQMSDAAIAHPFSIDITEIDGFDNLHHATAILQDAQEEAAEFYGVQESIFSVNGSTAALLSVVSAAVRRGGKILMARNCHKAVYHAVYLRDLEAKYLYPKWELQTAMVNGPIRPADVELALEADVDIQAVLITSPTYDGVVSDVAAIAAIAHRYGVPLLVDEAHGAHFGLHPYFPVSAVKLGADVVVQSLHKTLPALTQTAILHRCSDRVSSEALHRFMGIYQTSSPSYVLMSSITSCIHVMKDQGNVLFGNYVNLLQTCRERLKELKRIHLVEAEIMDPSKLVLSVENLSMTGSQLYTILLEKYHLQMEMEAPGYVLALTSVGDTEEGFMRLCAALEEIDRNED